MKNILRAQPVLLEKIDGSDDVLQIVLDEHRTATRAVGFDDAPPGHQAVVILSIRKVQH